MHIDLTKLLKQAHLTGYRLLVFLPINDPITLKHITDAVKSQYNTSLNKKQEKNLCEPETLHVKRLPTESQKTDIADQINALLGSENKLIIYDVSNGFNASLFAAAAGTIVAGGALVVLINEHNNPGTSPQLLIQKLQTSINRRVSRPSLFLERINHKIKQDCLVVSTNTYALDPMHYQSIQQPHVNTADTSSAQITEPWRSEQDHHLQQVLQLINDEKSQTIVIQADRGRGKSALLGRALAQCTRKITLTASRKEATTVLCQFASSEKSTHAASIAAPEFMSVDTALAQQHDLLIVEEAGSLPLPVLLALMKQSKQIIFATTVQGYEGAGRGFAIRFAKLLNQYCSSWRLIQPQLSIRWSDNDPLERFTNELLLLNAQLPSLPNTSYRCTHSHALLVDKQQLANDENLLSEVYGLLVQAHYQTTPADLRNLLDEEQLLVFVQRTDKRITGAALVALEGNIKAALTSDILSKRRRLHDQLLPQLLAQTANNGDALSYRYARIVRIAIHPELHRQGFGSALLNDIRKKLHPDIDALGASFGADNATVAFWKRQGLNAFHLGLRLNPRSGLRASAMLETHKDSVQAVLDEALSIFNANLAYRTGTTANPLEILLATSGAALAKSTYVDNAALLQRFINKERTFADTIAAIVEFCAQNPDKDLESAINAMVELCKSALPISPKQVKLLENSVRSRLTEP